VRLRSAWIIEGIDLVASSCGERSCRSCCLGWCQLRVLFTSVWRKALIPPFHLDLLQVTCSWNDVAELRRKLERSCSSGTMQFRYRVLQAVMQLQVWYDMYDMIYDMRTDKKKTACRRQMNGSPRHAAIRSDTGSNRFQKVFNWGKLKTVGRLGKR